MLFALWFTVCANSEDVGDLDKAIDVKDLLGQSESGLGLPVFLMAVASVGFLTFFGVKMKRIYKEVTAAAPLYDLANPETRMTFTIPERGENGD
jgi:hypothetical protein